jgi:hypothetical protein
LSSVEIKVVTVVVTTKVNLYNDLYGLSSMSSLSSLKKHIIYADQSLCSLVLLHIWFEIKGKYSIIYSVFLAVTVVKMMTSPLTYCF